MRGETHFALLEAVNSAKTDEEHRIAEARLNGYRLALEESGCSPGALIMEGDWFYIDRGVERPMCGGVFLDWEAQP